MAQIAPFQGLRFNLPRSTDPAALLAPPYDVISERHREELESRHERNVVHLDLPRGDGDRRYELAGGLLGTVEEQAPELDATTGDGVRHRLWAVTNPITIAKVARVMAPKQVMIADGHHRYETMITLRDELRPSERPPAQSLADWGTV